VTNGVPREQLAGRSRQAALRAGRPSAAQQAADRACIQALKERHERLRRSHWREKIKPAARRLGDQDAADGILDRIIHNSYRIDMKGESQRRLRSPLSNPATPEAPA